MGYGFGVDIGGTTVKLACFEEEGKLISQWEIPTRREDSGSQILPDIAAAISSFLQERSLSSQQVIGIGVGVPGAVEPDGTVNRCVNLGWGRVDICGELQKLTGFPVKAGNDATVAALGECWMGGGKGCRNMVLVTLGTGVGGGIVIDGKVVPGAHGAAGEIGHMTVNRQESEICTCGKRGCAEQYCSATGIVRVAKNYLKSREETSVLRENENFSCKDVFDAAAAGDGLAKEILEQVYAYLGESLANVCCVVDPEVVVLGGGVSRAGAPLVEGVSRYFASYCFHACKDTRFTLASLGNDAGIYGAFKLLLD